MSGPRLLSVYWYHDMNSCYSIEVSNIRTSKQHQRKSYIITTENTYGFAFHPSTQQNQAYVVISHTLLPKKLN